MSEILNYKNNVQNFVSTLEQCHIEELVYYEDLEPTFDKNSLPFKFRYCHSIMFITDRGNFLLQTSLTSMSYETFWINSTQPTNKITSEQFIDSKVKTVAIQNKYDNLPYKLIIELENGSLTIYAAEIHDDAEKKYVIVMPDEMIFVFDSEHEAKKFEVSNNDILNNALYLGEESGMEKNFEPKSNLKKLFRKFFIK